MNKKKESKEKTVNLTPKQTSIFDIAKKDSKIKTFMEDCYYDVKDEDHAPRFISTNVMSINVMLSGKLNGGIPMGKMSMISAPSMLGKTFIAMSTLKNAQKKGMNVAIVDTEGAFSPQMAESLGIDTDPKKLFVFQDNGIEKVTTFIIKIFDGLTRAERKNTLVILDSWGTLVTSKTMDDGASGKDVRDMTITQKKNTLANILLNTKATWLVINHVYDNIGGFGEMISIPGGRKIMFNCDCVILGMTRAKDKEDVKDEKGKKVSQLNGHIINSKAYKSRYCKENTQLRFRIKHNGGLDPYYGILDDALIGGYVEATTGLYGRTMYIRPCVENDEKFSEEDVYTAKFWGPIFKNTDIKDYFEKKYKFSADTKIKQEQEMLDDMLG
jgi:RecA/RadA recombinase